MDKPDYIPGPQQLQGRTESNVKVRTLPPEFFKSEGDNLREYVKKSQDTNSEILKMMALQMEAQREEAQQQRLLLMALLKNSGIDISALNPKPQPEPIPEPIPEGDKDGSTKPNAGGGKKPSPESIKSSSRK